MHLSTTTTNRTPAYLRGLNPEQAEAVRHTDGPLLVLAGAGSGKTRVLTCRIVALLQDHGVRPEQILALTFTNKAANEMKERVARLTGSHPQGMWIGTFHGFGASVLRQNAERLGWTNRFSIFDADDALRLVRRIIDHAGLSSKEFSPQGVRGEIGAAKNILETPSEYLRRSVSTERRQAYRRTVASLYEQYDAELARQNAFDFEDLLVKPIELFRRYPDVLGYYADRYRYILVDEYQDTNVAQYQMLSMLARHRNLFVVGDADQAIYSWRQADIRNIIEFEKDFLGARTIVLEQNYRSTGHILEAANHLIRHNKARKEKRLWTARDAGEPVVSVTLPSDRDEAAWIADEIRRAVLNDGADYSDFAVLYRTNAQSRLLEEAMRARCMPYEVVGGFSFYERREVRDALAYLKLIANPADEAAFERIVNFPRRGVGEKSLEVLLFYARGHGISALEAARQANKIEELSKGARAGLTAFAALIDRFRALAPTLGVGELLRQLVRETDMMGALVAEGVEGQDRAENVRELIRSADEFSNRDGEGATRALERFLEEATLVSQSEDKADVVGVTLASLHAAKGLEFRCVFVSGLEDGLFPHDHALDSWEGLEEERRLFYVGITRARDRLLLTRAVVRRRGSEFGTAQASRFLGELPDTVRSLAARTSTAPATTTDRRARPAAPHANNRQQAPAPKGESDLAPGQRVRHPTFGCGTVADVIGTGAATQMLVDFDEVGRRRLLARYAGLRPA